jgi:hypothetical protein
VNQDDPNKIKDDKQIVENSQNDSDREADFEDE